MKNKKVLLTMVMIAVLAVGAMMLSAFTNAKQNAKFECAQTVMDDDDWIIIRENVPYCDADKDVCEGYGIVWGNTETYQVAFSMGKATTKYDLSEYTKKEGYNMRFWHDSKYYYVNIYIPRNAFNR